MVVKRLQHLASSESRFAIRESRCAGASISPLFEQKGTPGRVFHMIQDRHFSTKKIKMFVLDEADELLNRGFKDQIYDIYRYLPPGTQVVLVSATLPHEVLEMTHKSPKVIFCVSSVL